MTEILVLKRVQVARAKEACAKIDIKALARDVRASAEPHRLRAALERDRLNIIAEVKRASPSKGIINAEVEPAILSKLYEAGGAAAVSVLTEEERFHGSLDDLMAVRAAVRLPLLRKDFIFDEFQLYEAAHAGADALLLIVAALDDETLTRLRRIAEEELKMDALIEVHTKDELRKALDCGAQIIGVNNRNLRTFQVSLDVSTELAREIPSSIFSISESGLKDGDDLRRLRALGYKGFLIGETLMRAGRPDETLRALIEKLEIKR